MNCMDRVDDATPSPPLRWPRIAAVIAAIFVAAALLCAWWLSTSVSASDPSGPAAAIGLFVLALLTGAAAVAWVAFRQQRLASQLRDARARLQCLDDLLDVWQWQSDRDHRLTVLRPPEGAGNHDWSALPPKTVLWELLRADDESALRAQLARAAPLQDIAVHRDNGEGVSRRCMLRGRVRTDAMGAFEGYTGTLREMDDMVVPPVVAVVERPTAPVMPVPMPAPESEHESFGYTVSHDLRAPIRVVEGFTKIVKEDYGRLLDRVGNDHLDRVLGAAARMNSMIDALLALSKLSSQPLAHQPVNLSQLAGYVSDDLRRQWPDRQVTIAIEPGLQVQGDPTLLRVVLENLLGNAWKYSSKNAEAHIEFGRSTEAPDSFVVRDNGAGFDMRFADRLFGVFQRLHSANDFPGTGVGLASVRRIVRRHGGEIWGEAEVNRGARFHFSLPQGEKQI
ncbi:hypothetical protein BH11PSE8_BH11PSE8_38920 [soil metagenome]